jgi:hypothetical protein
MVRLWRDPRTGIYELRRRVPEQHSAVAKGQTIVKISTGEKDDKAALAKLPDVLARWETMKADWRREASRVRSAAEVAAKWAAWIARDRKRLQTDGLTASTWVHPAEREHET